MINIRVQSLSQFVDIINQSSSSLKINETLSFRGQPDESYDISPSIARFGLGYEKELIRQASVKYPHIFKEEYSAVQQLSVLQHYSIPTRLLDITKNALVALYFACMEETGDEGDGAVIVFKHPEYGDEHPFIQDQVAYTCRLKDPGEMDVDLFCQRASIDSLKNHYFVHLPSLLYRQSAQAGNYILFANDMVDGKMLDQISPMSKEESCISEIITIAKESKDDIIKALEFVGITEETLFPENVDKGCNNIKIKIKRNIHI